jgi:hypothetical protein
MNPEEIAAVKQEIETFSQKSIQHATTNPVLSAHYNRLYRASQLLLNKAVKLEQAAARKKHVEARRQAKQTTPSGTRPSGNATGNPSRQTA